MRAAARRGLAPSATITPSYKPKARPLSDDGLRLQQALSLPVFEVNGQSLLKRITLVLSAGVIEHVFYPIFPPDRHSSEVPRWLRVNPAASERA